MAQYLSAFAMVAASFVFSQAAVAQAAGDPGEGKKLAELMCRNCHDVSGNEKPKNPPGAAPSFFDVAQRPDTTEKYLHRYLSFPHGNMNIITLTAKEVDSAVAYILSMTRK